MFTNFFNGKYRVERSILIEKPVKDVFQTVLNLKSWNSWSPWILHEPNTPIEYSSDVTKEGSFYIWNGKLVGEGKLTHQKIVKNQVINQKLEFIRPFRSVCKVGWVFEEQKKNTTKTTWIMEGKMPFLFRLFIPKMKVEIAKDYEFGLAMLSGKVNPKAEFPVISFVTEQRFFNTQQYLVHSYQGNLKTMAQEMPTAIDKLEKHIKKSSFEVAGALTTIYYKVNSKTGDVVCDFALPVAGSGALGGYSLKTLPKQKYFQTNLKGNYHFLEMAWRQAFNHVKMKKLKRSIKKPCFEVYPNDPRKLKNTNNYLTEIYIPIQ